MKIFCMICGLLMLSVGFKSHGETTVWDFLIIAMYFSIAGFLIAFPLYLEFWK